MFREFGQDMIDHRLKMESRQKRDNVTRRLLKAHVFRRNVLYRGNADERIDETVPKLVRENIEV